MKQPQDALIIVEFKLKPRYVTTFVGVRQLFLVFRVSPNFCKWARTTSVLLLACCSVGERTLKVKPEVLYVILVHWDVKIGILEIHCCEPVPFSDES